MLLTDPESIKSILLTGTIWCPVRPGTLKLLDADRVRWQTDDGTWVDCHTISILAVARKKTYKPGR